MLCMLATWALQVYKDLLCNAAMFHYYFVRLQDLHSLVKVRASALNNDFQFLSKQLLVTGIAVPSFSTSKAKFVELYDMHIGSRQGQFSSDDEVQGQSSSGRKSKKVMIILI